MVAMNDVVEHTSRRSKAKRKQEAKENLPPVFIQNMMMKIEEAKQQEKFWSAFLISVKMLICCVFIMFFEYFGRAIILGSVYMLVVWYFINLFGK